MAMVKSGSFSPVLTIVGKDLDLRGTFNSDVVAGQGLLPAGRLMTYDAAAKAFTAWDLDPLGAGNIFGVLAFEIDGTDPAAPNLPGMVYRAGTFLRQEIEFANQIAIPPNGPVDVELRNKGLLLEWSYEDYVGLDPAPPGVSIPIQG